MPDGHEGDEGGPATFGERERKEEREEGGEEAEGVPGGTGEQDASTTARRTSLLHEKNKEVAAWLASRQLPQDLQDEVIHYYADTWITQAGAGPLRFRR